MGPELIRRPRRETPERDISYWVHQSGVLKEEL